MKHSARRIVLISSIAALVSFSASKARAQWTGTAADNVYNNPANWTGGTVNGIFSTTAPGSSLMFDADITTNINIQIDTIAGGTTLSGSGGTRTITLNGDLKASGAGVDTTITIANSLILNLNGATRTLGNTSSTGTWNIDAKITGTAGVVLGGGTGFVNLNNTANDFTGSVTFNRRGGSFTSIADGGVACALGKGTTITINDALSFGSVTYTGSAASSNRTWNWNNGSNSYAFNHNGTGTLTLNGNWNFTNASVTTFAVNATNANLVLDGVLNDSSAASAVGLVFGGAQTKTLSNASNSFEGAVTAKLGTLEFKSVADSGVASSLGKGSTINLGDSAANTAATLRYIGTDAGGHSTNRTLNLAGTAGAVTTIEANGVGALSFSSALTVAAGNKTLTLSGTSAAGVLNGIQGAIIDGSGGTTSVIKAGANTWMLSGANSYTGTTSVIGGTLVASGSLSGTASIIESGGSTFQLGAANVVNNAATVSLSASTFATGGFGETVGTLSLGAGLSTIDFGSGASVFAFADSSSQAWVGTLSIANWTGSLVGGGTDQLYFGNAASGLTSAQIAAIQFVNPAGLPTGSYGAQLLPTGELVAVPEPGSLVAIIGGAGCLLGLRRRSRSA